MRGLGKYTKRGSGLIVGGVCGGAVVPPILGATADAYSTATAMLVPMCFFVAAWTYALCVNFVPSYREPADKFSTAKIGLRDPGANDEEKNSSGDEMGEKGMVENHENVRSDEIKRL